MKVKSIAAFLVLASLGVLTVSCAPQEPPPPPDTRAADEAAIRDADAAWSKTAEAKNLDAMIAYYTDDAISMPPNEPLASGREAVRKAMGAMFALPGFSLKWQAAKVEVARSADIGYSQGTYEFGMTDPKGKPIMDHGKYLTIWKKQPDGTWKVAVDTFNSDVPVAPPPPVK